MSDRTDQIESDISDSRHRLNDTLNALGSKLSPGQMLDEVMGLAKGQAGQFTSNLGRQVKDNPVPAVLIGVGVAMLMVGGQQRDSRRNGAMSFSPKDRDHEQRYRSIEQVRRDMPRLPDESDDDYHARLHDAHARALGMTQNAHEAFDAFKSRVAGGIEEARAKAGAASERMSAKLAGMSHAVGDGARDVQHKAGAIKHRAKALYGEAPLAGGAIAMAIGALIGAVTPLSSIERSALGDVADTANRMGAALANKGADMAEKAVDAVH